MRPRPHPGTHIMKRAPSLCSCGRIKQPGHPCVCRGRHQVPTPDARPNRHARGYDADWVKLRAKHLKANPACVVCGAPATTVDHKISVRARPELRLVPSNLQSMCASCHGRKTVREDGGFGNERKGRGASETFEGARGPTSGASRAIFPKKRTIKEGEFPC